MDHNFQHMNSLGDLMHSATAAPASLGPDNDLHHDFEHLLEQQVSYRDLFRVTVSHDSRRLVDQDHEILERNNPQDDGDS
jgi:hypothetical protein